MREGVFLVCFVYCHCPSLNSAWHVVGAKKYLLNEWMKIGGHFQNHGSCCVLLAWPVEVIDEFFKYLGPATTFMCVLCQGLSTVDALGISVGCHVAMINLMVAFGIYLA